MTPEAGSKFGAFRLLRLIGRGGTGVVYLAERVDGEVHQQVAVKLLRSAFDSPEARERFLRERQILALLDHPNVARLIDAGHGDNGNPYLAMEYVEGRPLDEYAKGRGLREKAELMVAVCEAIASAHQRLIVHRDLKPGNILVDREGRPKVLDFGIATLTDESDTATAGRRLTPEYASPEQTTGGVVTTASDIYSLGLLLQKLLEGTKDRDLRAVVAKATRTEAEERYATAEQLSDDLKAWLRRRPVMARQGERWYGIRKRVRRYWPVLLPAGLAMAGMTAGLLLALRERDVAQQRFDDVRRLAKEFFVVERDMRGMPGAVGVREKMVRTSIGYLESLSNGAGRDWKLKAEIAAGYRSAAEAQGLARALNLGRESEAVASLEKAEALMGEARQAAPGDREVLKGWIELREMQSRVKPTAEREKELQGLLAEYEKGLGKNVEELRFAGKMYESLTTSAREMGRMEAALGFSNKSVELNRRMAAVDGSFAARGGLSNSLTAFAMQWIETGDLQGAMGVAEEAMQTLNGMLKERPEHFTARLNLANLHALAGRTLGHPWSPNLGRTEESLRHFEESLRIGRELIKADAKETQARFNHAVALWRFADTVRARNAVAARGAYEESIALLRPLAARPARDAGLAAVLARSAEFAGAGRLAEAESLCESRRADGSGAYEACRDVIVQVKAAKASAADAAALHRGWLKLEPVVKLKSARDTNLHSAHLAALHLKGWRDAARSAKLSAEAEQAENELQALRAVWTSKTPDDVLPR